MNFLIFLFFGHCVRVFWRQMPVYTLLICIEATLKSKKKQQTVSDITLAPRKLWEKDLMDKIEFTELEKTEFGNPGKSKLIVFFEILCLSLPKP